MAQLKLWKFFSVLMVVMLIAALGAAVVPASPVAANGGGGGWSDNFNDGPQQSWTNVNQGTNSSFSFINNRYELHTEYPLPGSSFDGVGVSYVNSPVTDCIMQAKVERINSGDKFLAYLIARGNVAANQFYSLGISSGNNTDNQVHLWLGKYNGATYTNLGTGGSIFPWETGDYNWHDCYIKFAVFGNTLKGKVWKVGASEPEAWQVTATDSSFTSGIGGVMLATYHSLGWDMVQTAFDDVSLTSLSKAEIWVDNSWAGKSPGDEVGPGKIFGYNAFATIQAGIDAVDPNGTVNVAAGTYTENVDVSKSLTLRGAGAATTIVQAAANTDHVFEITANGVNISGFTSTGATASKAGVFLSGNEGCSISEVNATNNYHGIDLVGSSNNTLTNNNASENDASGIFVSTLSNNNTLTGNIASNNYYGICVDNSTNNTIRNNTVQNNTFSGIFATINTDVSTLTVNFNSIAGNGAYGVYTVVTGTLDATNNWWGANSGPYHPTNNPDGKGDKVSDNVTFRPWLAKDSGSSQQTTSTTGISAKFTLDEGIISNVSAILPPANPPVSLPYGMFGFTISNIAPNGTVTVTITFSAPVPAGSQYWKYQNNGKWINCTSLLGSNDGDSVLTLQLTDGGLGDADGRANGIIVDPGGPAFAVAPPTIVKYTTPQPTSHGAGGVPLPAPAAPVALSNVTVTTASISASKVAPGTPVTVTASVTNAGSANGSARLKLFINGAEETSQGIALESGQTMPVEFTITKNQPGTYSVAVSGIPAGSFVVDRFSDPNFILYISIACLFFALALGVIIIYRKRQLRY